MNRFPAERVDPGWSTPDSQTEQDCAVRGEAGQGNDPVNRFPAERVDPGRSTLGSQAEQDCAAPGEAE